MIAYATVDEYRLDSGDLTSSDERIESKLNQQSAKLRAKAGISSSLSLTEDQKELAKFLVIDATRKSLVKPSIDGVEDTTGIKQSSFSADGFQSSYTFENPSGVSFFDNDTFKAFMRSLGKSQRIGNILPYYGG